MLSFFNEDGSFAEALQFIEEGVPLGLFSIDLPSRVTRWSPGMYRVLGVSPDMHRPTADAVTKLIDPTDRAAWGQVELAMRIGVPLHLDLKIINPTGRPRWVRFNAEFLLDARGKPGRMIGSLLDVSIEHEARRRSEALQLRFDALRSVCSSVWWTTEPDGRIERIEGWEELTGQNAEQSRGKGWAEVIHPDDIERLVSDRDRAIAAGLEYAIELRVRRTDGSFRWMVSRCAPIRDEFGEITEWLGTLTDVHMSKEWPASAVDSRKISGAQIRGARAIVNWSVKQLSEASGVPVSSIRRIEDFDGAINSLSMAMAKIRHALEQAGADFVAPPVGKPAVRPS